MKITRKELFAAAVLAGLYANPEYVNAPNDTLAEIANEQAEEMDGLLRANAELEQAEAN